MKSKRHEMVTRTTPLICVVGHSGTGKSTIVDASGLNEVISYTDRAPRESESEGKPYRFVTREHMHEMNDEGLFAEMKVVYDQLKAATWEDLNTKDVFIVSPSGMKEIESLGFPVIKIMIHGTPFKQNRTGQTEFDLRPERFDLVIYNHHTLDHNADFLRRIHRSIVAMSFKETNNKKRRVKNAQ